MPYTFAIRYPVRTLVIAALVAAGAMAGLSRLEWRTDGQALVPEHSATVRFDREVRERFGIRDPIAVVLRRDADGGIFDPGTLRQVVELSATLAELDGVRAADVVSLATEVGFRHQPGELTLRTFLDPLPTTPREIDELRSDLARIELYRGILVSYDETATAILVGTPESAERSIFVDEVRRLAPADAEVLGASVAEVLLGRHILHDLMGGLLDSGGGLGMVPIAFLLMGTLFLLAFRRPLAALLPLSEAGVAVGMILGLMGWCGSPVYLTTAVLPIILTAIGLADEIHIFHRYTEISRRRCGVSRLDLVRQTFEEMTPPVVRTSVTTAVAFLSFALSPIAPVRLFGLWTALGIGLCLLYSMTVIPACLVVLGPRMLPSGPAPGRSASETAVEAPRFFSWLARCISRHRRMVLAGALLVAVVALDGVRRIEVQDSWIDGFAPQSPFGRSMQWFDEQFLGSHLLRIELDIETPRRGGEIAETALEDERLTLDGPFEVAVASFQGAWLHVFQIPEDELASPLPRPRGRPPREWTTWVETATLDDAGKLVLTLPQRGGSPRFWLAPQAGEPLGYEIRGEPFTTPANLARIDALETFLKERPGVGGVLGPARLLSVANFLIDPENPEARHWPEEPRALRRLWSNFGVMRGPERLAQLLETDQRRALVTVYLKAANHAATRLLFEQIREYETAHLKAHGIRLGFAGDVAVSQALIDVLVKTQVYSLLLSLIAILVVTSWLGRSLRRGVLSVLPSSFAVLITFAVMGWSGIPLGVATSMFACMTLGVGVDFAIHLLARCERVPLAEALAGTGPAVLIDALAVGLGFGVLILSQVPANARLGGLLMTSVSGCLLATFFLVPALRSAGTASRE